MVRPLLGELDQFLNRVALRNPGEPEFHQAVSEVIESVYPVFKTNQHYQEHGVLDRIVEPERVILFKVTWQDDNNKVHVNKGYRIQFSSILGPYKGGLRFHPTVNLSVLKFLGFEQVFKNSLLVPGLMLGGAKGGSDFDPKGRSDFEIMRFCHSFMAELCRHIGPNTDVPAGDIGVGAREIGYLFGHYRKMTNTSTGTITGKGVGWGGSEIRTEATGYGLVCFVREMLKHHNEEIAGKTVAISGSGNVAQFAAERAIKFCAKVVTMSDSSGFIHDPAGIDQEKLAFIKRLKNEERGRIKEYAVRYGVDYCPDKTPWQYVRCDIALPCATENEIDEDDARALVQGGTRLVAEGANMPSTREAIKVFYDAKILFGPGKAANAGGVAVSGLEMAQDSIHMQWEREDVLAKLEKIMLGIHNKCVRHGKQDDGFVNYVQGANVAGFLQVANAMVDQGL